MRTNDLRKLINTQLLTLKTTYGIKGVYYGLASEDAMYPHIVFELDSIDYGQYEADRKDYSLTIDVWTKGTAYTNLEDISDAIEDLLHTENLPQSSILPTFYLESRKELPDEDKEIKRIEIQFVVQTYKK